MHADSDMAGTEIMPGLSEADRLNDMVVGTFGKSSIPPFSECSRPQKQVGENLYPIIRCGVSGPWLAVVLGNKLTRLLEILASHLVKGQLLLLNQP